MSVPVCGLHVKAAARHLPEQGILEMFASEMRCSIILPELSLLAIFVGLNLFLFRAN